MDFAVTNAPFIGWNWANANPVVRAATKVKTNLLMVLNFKNLIFKYKNNIK